MFPNVEFCIYEKRKKFKNSFFFQKARHPQRSRQQKKPTEDDCFIFRIQTPKFNVFKRKLSGLYADDASFRF